MAEARTVGELFDSLIGVRRNLRVVLATDKDEDTWSFLSAANPRRLDDEKDPERIYRTEEQLDELKAQGKKIQNSDIADEAPEDVFVLVGDG